MCYTYVYGLTRCCTNRTDQETRGRTWKEGLEGEILETIHRALKDIVMFSWIFTTLGFLYTSFISLGGAVYLRWVGGGGGAQRSIFHLNEPKKMGARSTRAHKIRPVNSVSLFVILVVCLSVLLSLRNAALLFGTVIFKMTRERGWGIRDGEVWKGEIWEWGFETIVRCFSLT